MAEAIDLQSVKSSKGKPCSPLVRPLCSLSMPS